MANQNEKGRRLSVEKLGKFYEDPDFKAARAIFPKQEDQSSSNLGSGHFPPMDCVFYYDDRFEALIDVIGLEAEDLIVTLTHQTLTVEGNKKTQVDDMQGNIAFKMAYGLPQKINGCTCKMSSDGVLVITAVWETPRKPALEQQQEEPHDPPFSSV